MMNNFLEFISKDIDGKKEQIGSLPVKTKVNKRNYNETLEMMSTKYKSYKENVYKYLSVKAKNLIKVKPSEQDEQLLELISDLEDAKKVLNPFNTYVEKMDFDSLLYQMKCCYTLNFKSLNHIVNGFLDKFEDAGIHLSSSDFDYTCYVNQYMDSFLEIRYKGDKDYSRISEIFEQIYWLNPELIQHIDLNFRKLIRKYGKKFNDYLDKKKNEIKKTLGFDDYEECLSQLSKAYIELNEKSRETIGDIVDLFMKREIDVEHYREDNKVRKFAFSTLLGNDVDFSNKTKINRLCEDLERLKLNLIELGNYLSFKPLFDDFINQYGKLENNASNKKNKELKEFENKIIKVEAELDKMNKKISSGKKSLFGGVLTEIEIKNIKIDSVLKAKELYELYKTYEEKYFVDRVEALISPNMSVTDFLKLYSSFNYFKKMTIQRVFELANFDEVEALSKKFDEFSGTPLNNVMEGVLIFAEFDIPRIICTKYRLSGILLEEESLNEDNIDALLNKVNIILRANIIDNSDIPLDKIWFVTKVNSYNKD